MSHRVMYLRDKHYQPHGCVAIQINPRTQFVEYNISTLNPADRFDRKVARELALGRMLLEPETLRVPRNPSLHDISIAVMRDLACSKTAPSRAVKSAKLWLDHNDW